MCEWAGWYSWGREGDRNAESLSGVDTRSTKVRTHPVVARLRPRCRREDPGRGTSIHSVNAVSGAWTMSANGQDRIGEVGELLELRTRLS